MLSCSSRFISVLTIALVSVFSLQLMWVGVSHVYADSETPSDTSGESSGESSSETPGVGVNIQGNELGDDLNNSATNTVGDGYAGIGRLWDMVQLVVTYIFIIGTASAVLMLIVSGVQYMTGYPDAAKERIKNTLWGLALLLFMGALMAALNPGFFGAG